MKHILKVIHLSSTISDTYVERRSLSKRKSIPNKLWASRRLIQYDMTDGQRSGYFDLSVCQIRKKKRVATGGLEDEVLKVVTRLLSIFVLGTAHQLCCCEKTWTNSLQMLCVSSIWSSDISSDLVISDIVYEGFFSSEEASEEDP